MIKTPGKITATYGQLVAARSGNVVTLNGYNTTSINGETTVCTIAAAFRPGDTIRALCNVGSNAFSVDTLAYVCVRTDGVVNVTPQNSSGTYSTCYMSLSWIV
jgi:hypothetical protein